MVTLTEKQKKAETDVLGLLKENDIVVLTGKAGTGKTTLANSIAKNFKSIGHGGVILCSAPTNKALHVIRGKMDNIHGMAFKTVHSALHLKRKIDFKTGAETFAQSNINTREPLKGVNFMLIDEASMIGEQLLSYILKFTRMHGVKLLFLGDTSQLPPIGEESSQVFTSDYPTIELTEIIRQGEGNPIIELSRNLEQASSKVNNRSDIGGYIYTDNLGKVVTELAKVNGTDDLKYLAWTNREVDKINALVRKEVYGTPKKIEQGETMVVNTPYKEKYYTNEEIRVVNVETKELNLQYVNATDGVINPKEGDLAALGIAKLTCYVITCEKLHEETIEELPKLLVIHEKSEAEFKKIKNILARKAKIAEVKWTDYYHFIEQFADLKYNHAITVHKSQGSTYKRAIINVKNINMNRDKKEKAKLLYTAVTRASNLLILYNV